MDGWDIVDVEGVLIDALDAAGIAASAVIRVNPEAVTDADLERMPYVHVQAVEGGEDYGPWRMDPYLLTCYGSTPAAAWDLGRAVIDLADDPMFSPTYGLIDCCDTEGPVRDPSFGDNGDDRVNAVVVRVSAETRRGPNPAL